MQPNSLRDKSSREARALRAWLHVASSGHAKSPMRTTRGRLSTPKMWESIAAEALLSLKHGAASPVVLFSHSNGIELVTAADPALPAVNLDTIVNIFSAMRDDFAAMRDDFAAMRDDFAAMREDVAVIRDDVAVIRDDVAAMRDDVAAIRDDVAVMRYDVAAIRDDVAAMRDDVAAMRDDVSAMRDDVAAMRDDIITLVASKNGLTVRIASLETRVMNSLTNGEA